MTERIVVIGADAAGMSAASQAKRIAGDAVEIVAFERGAYSSYSASPRSRPTAACLVQSSAAAARGASSAAESAAATVKLRDTR